MYITVGRNICFKVLDWSLKLIYHDIRYCYTNTDASCVTVLVLASRAALIYFIYTSCTLFLYKEMPGICQLFSVWAFSQIPDFQSFEDILKLNHVRIFEGESLLAQWPDYTPNVARCKRPNAWKPLVSRLTSIHSFFYTRFIMFSVVGVLEPIAAVIRRETGCTLNG